MQDILLSVKARNKQDEPRKQREEDDHSSSYRSGGSSHGYDSDHGIKLDCGKRRRNNRP